MHYNALKELYGVENVYTIDLRPLKAYRRDNCTIIASLGYISAIGHLLQHSRRSNRWRVLLGSH